MNDSVTEDDFVPGPLARELFHTDAEGHPGSPDDIIPAARLWDWEDLEPRALELLRDESAKPYDRFLACIAVATWGSAEGYRAVSGFAAGPATAPWVGYSVDRLYGADDTFGQLARAVADSREMADERGTREERIEALAAITLLAPVSYLDNAISPQGLYEEDMVELGTPLRTAVSESLLELGAEDAPGFNLAIQLAGLIAALGYADPDCARAAAADLITANPDDERIRRALGPLGTA